MKEIMEGLNTLWCITYKELADALDNRPDKEAREIPLPKPMPWLEGKTIFFQVVIYADRENNPKWPLKARLDGIKVKDGKYCKAWAIYPFETLDELADTIKWMGELHRSHKTDWLEAQSN